MLWTSIILISHLLVLTHQAPMSEIEEIRSSGTKTKGQTSPKGSVRGSKPLIIKGATDIPRSGQPMVVPAGRGKEKLDEPPRNFQPKQMAQPRGPVPPSSNYKTREQAEMESLRAQGNREVDKIMQMIAEDARKQASVRHIEASVQAPAPTNNGKKKSTLQKLGNSLAGGAKKVSNEVKKGVAKKADKVDKWWNQEQLHIHGDFETRDTGHSIYSRKT